MNDQTLCPFVRKPFQNCYCAGMSSLQIEAMIKFCNGQYRSCPIYRLHRGMEERCLCHPPLSPLPVDACGTDKKACFPESVGHLWVGDWYADITLN